MLNFLPKIPPKIQPGRLFCFGLGYSARILAAGLIKTGWKIYGTARRPEAIEAGRRAGYVMYSFDREQPLSTETILQAGITHSVISIPPDSLGDPVLDLYDTVLTRLSELIWVGYLSSTGVYGDRGGKWVDERDSPAPQAPRSQRRWQAEQGWKKLATESGLPIHIFRLAGIYGPQRSVVEKIKAGTARRIAKPGHLFGRIHVTDIAGVLLASMMRPNPGAIYNVTDDMPAAPSDVIFYACTQLGIPAPPEIPFEQADLSLMARSFWADHRLVHNQRIKTELGYQLCYPDYHSGLSALITAERSEA